MPPHSHFLIKPLAFIYFIVTRWHKIMKRDTLNCFGDERVTFMLILHLHSKSKITPNIIHPPVSQCPWVCLEAFGNITSEHARALSWHSRDASVSVSVQNICLSVTMCYYCISYVKTLPEHPINGVSAHTSMRILLQLFQVQYTNRAV